MVERELKTLKLIYENPQLSGNKLYIKSKSAGYGVKKKDFYILYRAARQQPEPTKEVQRKATPIKYRKPVPTSIPELFPKKYKQTYLKNIKDVKKEGSYNVVEVIMDEKSYYIKYKTRKQFLKHFKKLKEAYKPKKTKIFFIGKRFYEQYRTEEYIKLLAKIGL